MQIEKKSKRAISIIDNPDFFNLSFSKFLFSLVQIQYSELSQKHQLYNPSYSWNKFKQHSSNNTLVKNSATATEFIIHSLVYFFIPGWLFLGLFQILFSTLFWQFTITKIQILVTNHRLSIRTSVNTRPLNLTTILSILPFLIGFFYFFQRKYPDQLTEYFFEKNLPGVTLSSEKLHWDTVQYFLQYNCKKEALSTKKIQSFYQENSLFFNTNIFEENLGQKIFINNYKKYPLLSQIKQWDKKTSSLNQENFNLISFFSHKNLECSVFQNLDELPAYLESFSSETSFLNSSLLNIEKLNSSQDSDHSFSKTNSVKKTNQNKSQKVLNKIFFQPQQIQKIVTINLNSEKSNIFFGLNTNLKKEFLRKFENRNYEKNLLNNKFLNFQKEFHTLWDLFQAELRNFFLNKNLILNQNLEFGVKGFRLEEKATKLLNSEIESKFLKTLKEFFLLEEKMVFDEIFSSLNQKEIFHNPFETRRMSGYRYPDMTQSEINRLFLQQKLTPRWSTLSSPRNFLEIKFPSSFVETTLYNFNIEPFPNFSIATKPIILRDLETEKILYQGPGLILEKNNGLDWKTQIPQTDFEFKNTNTKLQKQSNTSVFDNVLQSNSFNLRLWFQQYMAPYPGFTKSTKNFFGANESPEFSPTTSSKIQHFQKQNWIQKLPIYELEKRDVEKGPSNIPSVTNLNESFFELDTELHVPFISSREWKLHYQKFLDKKNQQISSDSQNEECHFFPAPLLQTRLPKIDQKNSILNQINSQLSLHDNIDYHFDKNLFKLLNSNSINFSPTSEKDTALQNLLENDDFGTLFSTGTYKKNSTVFSSKRDKHSLTKAQNTESFFQDNWEPLSFHSWLIISQLGFAFFVFQILKALAANYGTELLVYFLDLVASTGIMDEELKQEIEILTGQREKGFRLISNSRKNFSDIAGIQFLLPEVAEIVWFLRNSAREFSLSKTLPRGILLVGPPGTGKTLLVQALAGEANVPVLALSGSSLVEPGESGALKLEILFQEARRLAPCIVFIDEIDTLAQKRDQVMQNPMGTDEILEVLTNPTNLITGSTRGETFQYSTISGTINSQKDIFQSQASLDPFSFSNSLRTLETQFNQQFQARQELQQEQLSLLMQLLIELDGIKGRDGVIVIGATNRPEMVDAAVLRPGRFDRVLELGLPGYKKRVEIFKLYSQKLGYDKSISWNYFAERTAGFTAADLASIINESSLKAIMDETYHTLETLEHGIDRITTSESQSFISNFPNQKPLTKLKNLLTTKNKNSNSQNKNKVEFNTSTVLTTRFLQTHRFAYYQAGKIICTSLLEYHPPILVAHLWPRRTNLRSLKIAENLQNSFFRFARRNELEHRIIGCYSGKVAEILFLQKLSCLDSSFSFTQPFNINLSTIGLEDILFGQILIKFLIENWYLYSIQPLFHSLTELSDNRNFQELSEEKIEFFDHLGQNLESGPRPIGQFLPEPLQASGKDQIIGNQNRNIVAQNNFSIAWWQQQISYELEFVEKNFTDWYRIYLPNPEETELNPEWSPPDEFYHRNKIQESLLSSENSKQEMFEIPNFTYKQQKFAFDWFQNSPLSDSSWNDLVLITQDYQTHSIVLQSCNKALVLVDQHRELLDVLASKLLSKKILRQWDIISIFKNYKFSSSIFEFPVFTTTENKTSLSKKHVFSNEVDNENFLINRNLSTQQVQNEKTLNFDSFDTDHKLFVNSDWGHFSRRKTANWIDFDSVVN